MDTSVARHACSINSVRNHFSSGVKYQLKIPNRVTEPKITQAYDIILRGSMNEGQGGIALTKLKVSEVRGNTNGESMTCIVCLFSR